MIKVLIKVFIKNYKSVEVPSVREKYVVFAGIIGIICNILLFAVKLSIGLIMNSIAIVSDAFNNLSDTGSSFVMIVGAKLSGLDPDQEHPYGHGRFEYIASLIISFIIVLVGFELLKSSIAKIINPVVIQYNSTLLIILIVSIFVKIWMFSYNTYIGKKINSSVNRAIASDSLNDIIATSAVVITTIAGKYINFPLDGIAGVIVSSLIMYTGFGVAKDTVKVLLGMSPSEELVNQINEIINSNKYILGSHDLKVHDYGPGRSIASIHTEVYNHIDLIKAHEIVDGIEKKIKSELGVDIVIHVDPIGVEERPPVD